jgi:2-polyprenyl-3-methyl-5-hydroxy-6-metoxy-1,4-benzoquinol methylase
MWKEVKKRTDEHGYMSGVDRMTDRVKETGEVFTPTDLVIEIIQKLGAENLAPGKTVIDPACGDGQFLVVAKWVKVLIHNMTEEDALKDIYGVDIMRDNANLCKMRLGGGNIVMGNTLEPNFRIPEQTETEYLLMREWFGSPTLESLFG